MFNKLFSKPQESQLKSFGTVGNYFNCFSEMQYINSGSLLNYQIQDFLNDYLLSPSLSKVINFITNKATAIEPVLKDIRTDKYVYKHDFLTLLKKPNPFEDERLFNKTFYSNQLLTGNAYANIVGSLSDTRGNKKPLEMQTLNPVHVTPLSDSTRVYADTYQYTAGSEAINYKYDVATQKYLSKDGNEIIHQMDYNPNYGTNCLLGSSRVQAIQLEIKQYLQASIHNYSLLKNQGRPSGMITADDDSMAEMQLEQQDQIKEQIMAIKGAQNAGKIAMLPFKLKWTSLSQSIKDMDFEKLKIMTEEAIYKAFNVPLSFRDERSSTMNNKNIARLDLYDDAVLPIVKWRNTFFTEKILKTRYPDGENLVLTYDEFTIETLRERKLQDAVAKDKLNKFSANEIRRDLGEESFVGGDTVYQPANLIPIGQDDFTRDNRDVPAKSFERDYYTNQMLRKGHKLEDIEKDLEDL